MIEINNISKVFRTSEVETVALNHVNLEVKEGEFVAIMGPSGSGKSTLMNILAGNLVVDEGDILLEGNSIKNTSVRKRAKDIARVFQDPKMGTASRLTIEENMAIAQRRGKSRGLGWGVREKDRECFREALKELNIGLENRLKVDTQYLSGGQRQALTLVMAALVRPKLLLLDEPSMGLAPIFIQEIFDIIQDIQKQGTTVLLIEQNANKALAIADRGYVLETGKVVLTGTGKELLASEEVRKAYLGG